MKQLIIFTFLISYGTSSAQLGNGLIAYYPFNNGNTENQAPTALYTIFAQGTTPTENAMMVPQQALAFAGSNPQLWIDAEGLVDFGTTTNFSFVTDFRSGSAASQEFFGTLLNTGVGWKIGFFNNNGYVTFESGIGGSLIRVHTTSTFNDLQWHQLALLVDRLEGTIRIFVDNVQQELGGTICGSPVSGDVADISDCVFNANEDNDQLTTFGAGLQGALDEIRLYGRLLTTTEVEEAYILSFGGSTNITDVGDAWVTSLWDPHAGILHLRHERGNAIATIHDALGRTLHQQGSGPVELLDLSRWGSQPLTVRLVSGDHSWVGRFIMVR